MTCVAVCEASGQVWSGSKDNALLQCFWSCFHCEGLEGLVLYCKTGVLTMASPSHIKRMLTMVLQPPYTHGVL